MGIFTKTFLSLTLPVLSIGVFASDADARSNYPANFDLDNYVYKANKAASPFESERTQQINLANEILDGKKGNRRNAHISQPVVASIGPKEMIENIETPWGETWFYTGSFKYSYIHVSEDYDRPVMQEFEFQIYDSQIKPMGTIRDKVSYKVYEDAPRDPATAKPEDIELYGPYHREVAVAKCEITPIITRNFFNRDEKIEIIVGISVQTTYYINNNYNKVYQLGGETIEDKDFEGNTQSYNKLIYEIPMQLGDVYSKIDSNGKEKTYMTFMGDYEPDEDIEIPDGGDEGSDIPSYIPGFWEQYCAYGVDAIVYRGVRDGETEIQPVMTKKFPLCRLPGDMQSTPFIMTLSHNDKPYIVQQYYEDTFYNPYHSPIDDMSMRENNKLVIEIYEENEDGTGFKLSQTTKIPIYLSESFGGNTIIASYFSAGDFRYRDDVNFTDFTDNGKAAFFITKQDYVAGQDDNYIRSYYLYDDNGALKNAIFEKCESHIRMSDIEGFEPQEMFIGTNSMGEYIFHFVDMKSLKEVLNLNYLYQIDPDTEPESLTSNMDRVKDGDSYKYANELRFPIQDEDNNDIARVIWINKDGSYDRTDEINMGTGVLYAQIYIDNSTLNPDYFYKDNTKYNEYMMLVKRGIAGEGAVEEVLVGQASNPDYPKGRIFLTDGPDERGALAKVMTYNHPEQPLLFITKYDKPKDIHSWDIYALPFTSDGDSSVDEIASSATNEGSIAFDGVSIRCEGASIEVFDIRGMKVAKGNGIVNISHLDAGIYIVTANGETLKVQMQ